eukprot:1141997-Pelagomonas_calceolata.AAC.6
MGACSDNSVRSLDNYQLGTGPRNAHTHAWAPKLGRAYLSNTLNKTSYSDCGQMLRLPDFQFCLADALMLSALRPNFTPPFFTPVDQA